MRTETLRKLFPAALPRVYISVRPDFPITSGKQKKKKDGTNFQGSEVCEPRCHIAYLYLRRITFCDYGLIQGGGWLIVWGKKLFHISYFYCRKVCLDTCVPLPRRLYKKVLWKDASNKNQAKKFERRVFISRRDVDFQTTITGQYSSSTKSPIVFVFQ